MEAEEPQFACSQLIVVLTPDWDSVQGRLFRFVRVDSGWVQQGLPLPVVVGNKGMGWGKGVHDFRSRAGEGEPVKVEGDKKSPAGVFELGTAFGYASLEDKGKFDYPYTPVRASTMCIEDGNSIYYNQIVDEGKLKADWNSTDHMLRKDDLYEWGVFVAHNSPEAEPLAGSCIFLHVWGNADGRHGTAGCTAMEKGNMRALIEWLDPRAQPHLAQVPAAAYAQLREAYSLPFISLSIR